MKFILTFVCVGIILSACGQPSSSALLKRYRGKNRIILLFGENKEAALLKEQQAQAEVYRTGYDDRDLLQFQITPEQVITPQGESLGAKAASDFYARYDVSPGRFTAILIGKDGGEKLRRTDEKLGHELLFRTIDAMPMRQREMENDP